MNIPMFWITLDLVELYYSGLSLRHSIIALIACTSLLTPPISASESSYTAPRVRRQA